jgi:L-alanine-DL-glutamate epimerase-like enolase superfamily enzyme
MKIKSIRVYPVSMSLRPECHMITALGVHTESHYVLVRLETDDGLVGAGEATVSERWSGETVWGAMALLEHVLIPGIVGMDPADIPSIANRLDSLARGNWFAKSALEMACWDVFGQAEKEPIHKLLGGPARPLTYENRFSMGAFDVPRAEQRAAELVTAGFNTIKVKVGGPAEADIARVRAVRQVIGPTRKLTIDANCGWDVETAIHCINSLEDCQLALVEQPTPDGDYGGLARVRRETSPPIMADDICFDLIHAQELIRNECCDVISVYPGKNGGIHRVACTIGSNLEYDVATAAMAHLVVGCENMKVEDYPGDSLGPSYHERSIALNPVQIEWPFTTAPDQPGLGVQVDWDNL